MSSSSALSYPDNNNASTLDIAHRAGDLNRLLVTLLEVRPAQEGSKLTQWQTEFASAAVSALF
jgi:hypothetical protein